ncbi:hypothetical protein ACFOFO_10365, partial [Undibacterium arcticum]
QVGADAQYTTGSGFGRQPDKHGSNDRLNWKSLAAMTVLLPGGVNFLENCVVRLSHIRIAF